MSGTAVPALRLFPCRHTRCAPAGLPRVTIEVGLGGGCDAAVSGTAGLLRRQEVLAWYVPPRRVDAWLAYRILSAVLVPVNDLGTQTYEYYCRVDGMVSRIS